jgi:hypothetical protein
METPTEGTVPPPEERSPSPLWLALPILLWTVLAIRISAHLAGKALDDFFITYRYAWNLAAGHGFTFNPGERVFGTTEPGLGLLLAGLTLLTRLPIPSLGTFVTGASLLGIAVLLLLEARERRRVPEAVVGGTLILLTSFLWVCHGAGAFPALFFLLLAARLGPERPLAAGLVAGLAVWLRPDAAVGTGLLGLLLWAERRKLPWIYGLAAGAVIASGAAMAAQVLGSVLPNTLAAKLAMATGGTADTVGARFWPRAVPLLTRHTGDLWPLLALLGALGQLPLLWRFRGESGGMGRPGRLLALFGLALAVLYPAMKVPFFPWYAVPVVIAVLYGVAFVAGALGRWVGERFRGPRTDRLGLPKAAALAVAALLLLPVFTSLLPASRHWFSVYRWFPYLATYRQAGLYIHQRSKPDDAIAYVEIGVLSYYSRQPVEDLLGLVTPAVLPYVEKNDLIGAFLLRPTTWVVYHTRGRMGPLLDRRWFWQAYDEVTRIKDSDGSGELTVLRRKPDGELPPAPPPGVGKWNRGK